ncbi:MAG: 30S ribosomal protein S17 [Proteobacteria bacterium]|jgi:small subunit ribosomal protein S17|nr:30S ribosomal protein S17 [Rhodospirillaceae bacterium]MBT4214889.1 30S ribosomal protein S17 [Bacteroidota bacterium]MBT6193474.1 30S ribosomal protein S17 [Pseudomonadota bacterium]MDG1274102.1 30S ribosomal protein S17 [Alphaproteobacteria bacterium]MDC1441344.1 30S ribosomal protein S17 [Rhodospirillaceae bacterium]|tara:strand:+ start:873 stop:1115 length:243 start_codon:yes stop_codon:yes gene_type:complete
MPKRELQGIVVSDKGDKTVVVNVERRIVHPMYKKIIKRSKRFAAHDEANKHKLGEVVRIRECAPKSKRKTWEVVDSASTD